MRLHALVLALLAALPRMHAVEGAPPPPAPHHTGPLPPEEQAALFSVPAGFRVELVAAEPDGGKYVALNFDHAGRLWTSTAIEYPVDANESPAEAKALFSRGGRDQVLVIDRPGAPGRQKPRVFAEGLAICLGVLPYKDGAFVQYGSEVRFYRDRDGDGRAEGFETVLSGFGIEDSHLFPHQFTRVPGGILLAQGAFNYSQVRTRSGKVVAFNKTKLARFTTDGNDFRIIGWGPCNIWGLVHDRDGRIWIQEANDTGWPMMPFLEGASYPLCGDDVPKPYAPPFPKTGGQPVGGTGLSGLALSEGSDAFPGEWRDVFFLANPITRKIQAMRATASNGAWRFEHLPDFLLSGDPMFRPVSMTLGPDGCLYIADWYNLVISHNEVPRAHPDRDKSHGRIWRVRHESQPHRADFPDLRRASAARVLESLRAANVVEGHAAWQELADRDDRSTSAALEAIVRNTAESPTVRRRALWALGQPGATDHQLLERLLSDPTLAFDAVRLIRDLPANAALDAAAFARIADDSIEVREEVIRLVADRLAHGGPDVSGLVSWLAQLGASDFETWMPGAPPVWRAYRRAFASYLVRRALEDAPEATTWWLDSGVGTARQRAFACLALGGAGGARRLASLATGLGRATTPDETVLLAQAAGEPSVQATLSTALIAVPNLVRLHERRDTLAGQAALGPLLVEAARALLKTADIPDNRDLVVKLATGFKLSGLAPELAAVAEAPDSTVEHRLAAVRALRESGTARIDLFRRFATSGDERLRREAVTALAAAKSDEANAALIALWPSLTPSLRRPAVERLAGNAAGARALLAAVTAGAISREELDGATLDKLGTVLPGDAALSALRLELGDSLMPVLRLDGGDADHIGQVVELGGTFTVETWIRLDPGIDNRDSILAGPGLDLNFHDARFRAFVGAGKGDIAIASRPVTPEAWAHVAVTRDVAGVFRIYLNGELDVVSTATDTRPYPGLKPGYSGSPGGTGADLAEFRIWNIARTPEEIRSAANLALSGPKPGLVMNGSGIHWPPLHGTARIERTADGPPVLGEAAAAALEAKFARFRGLASGPGDALQGRVVFTATCAPCHSVRGEGGRVGPVLDGAGAAGVEALLRNVLTPDAAMEAGYRRFRVETSGGETLEGQLAAQDADTVTLRQPNTEDQKFRRSDLRRAGFVRGSVMPSGLLEALPEPRVADLFAYLRTLR